VNKAFIYFVEDTETSFVLNDLKLIASRYERVILLSTESVDNVGELPGNTEVFDNFINWKGLSIKKVFFSNFVSILLIYLKECLACKRLLPLKSSIALLCSNFYKASECQKVLNSISGLDYKEAPFYAFWFYDCVYLARLKQLGIAKLTYIRAHGGDLFEERSSLRGKVLFRNYQLQYTTGVFSVSETGTKYLQNKYPKYRDRVETVYLGSPSHDYMNPLNSGERFVLVSCAAVRNIKRIHKIAEMLQFIDFPITWYHFGNENLQAKNDDTIPLYIENVKKLKPNVEFVPKGNMTNNEVLQFYREVPIDLFISLSEAEGVPVSMMEAISFGIPVLSTDVGGCKEIVTDETGILIPLTIEMNEIAKIITDFKTSHKNTAEYRSNVRLFWESKFDAKNLRLKI
jgi:glycosyltransferase involved in cell wall biosynthesis